MSTSYLTSLGRWWGVEEFNACIMHASSSRESWITQKEISFFFGGYANKSQICEGSLSTSCNSRSVAYTMKEDNRERREMILLKMELKSWTSTAFVRSRVVLGFLSRRLSRFAFDSSNFIHNFPALAIFHVKQSDCWELEESDIM